VSAGTNCGLTGDIENNLGNACCGGNFEEGTGCLSPGVERASVGQCPP